MAAFMSGLLSGFGSTLLEQKRKKHEEDLRAAESRKRILETVMNNPDTKPGDKQELLKILITPDVGTSGGKEKGKGKGKQQGGGDALSQFLERLGGMNVEGKASPGAGGGPSGASGGAAASPAPPQPSPEDSQFAPREGSVPGKFSVPPMPSGATNGAGKAQPTGSGSQPLSVKPMPTQGIFKTTQEKNQEEIDLEKARYEQITGPEKDKERKAVQDREDALIKAGNERKDAELKAQQEREDARQLALDTRLKSQQGFQERMERMRENATSDRQMSHDAAVLRLTDSKAADALGKQATAERQKNISETLKLMQQQLTGATGLLKSREAEAEKRGLMQFWKDAPDTQGAMEDVENAKAAISYLTDHKTAVISGKEDMDEVTAKTEDIIRNGQPEWSSSAWSQKNPGKDVKVAELAAMKAGMKVVP